MDGILLIAGDRQFRALVRAQLLEEGYEVFALPSLRIALADLVRGRKPPRAIVVDASSLDLEPQLLTDVWRLSGKAPLILCAGAQDKALLSQDGLPPAVVLRRPFRVGDVVAEVLKVQR